MGATLELLNNIQEFDGRKVEVKQFRERLEGLMRPKVTLAIREKNTAEMKRFFALYKKISRVPHLLSHYYKSVQVSLDPLWNEFSRHQASINESDRNAAKSVSFVIWLPTFLGGVTERINQEVKHDSKDA